MNNTIKEKTSSQTPILRMLQSIMRKKYLLLVGILLLCGCGGSLTKQFEKYFGVNIPKNISIKESNTVYYGPDVEYYLLLEGWSENDLKTFINSAQLSKFNLNETGTSWTSDGRVSTIPGPCQSSLLPSWWHRSTLLKINEIYGRNDESSRKDLWIFVDRKNKRLYISFGRY